MLQTFHNEQLRQDIKTTLPALLSLDESNARNDSSTFKEVILILASLRENFPLIVNNNYIHLHLYLHLYTYIGTQAKCT